MLKKVLLFGFVLTFFYISAIDLPIVAPSFSSRDRATDYIERQKKAYSWASTGFLYAACALFLEQLGERGMRSILRYFPSAPCCIAPAVGVTGSLSLTSLFFVKYREVIWYAHAVIFSGKRLSPYIAHEILSDLRSYVRYLDALKNMQVEMELLLAEVNSRKTLCLSAGELAKKIHQVVESGELYVRDVCRRLEALGLYRDEKVELLLQVVPGEQCNKNRVGDFISQSLELDAEAFDHLVSDLFAYWQGYLEGLMAHIEDKMVLCQRLLSFENALVNVLKQPLEGPNLEDEAV